MARISGGLGRAVTARISFGPDSPARRLTTLISTERSAKCFSVLNCRENATLKGSTTYPS